MLYSSELLLLLLNLLAAIVLLTISMALLFRKNNIKANRYLALILLYPAASILTNIVFIILRQHQWLFLAPVTIGFNLSFGPVLLNYLQLIQGKQEDRSKKRWLHFIPALLVLGSAVYFLALTDAEQLAQLNELLKGDHPYINLINLFLLVHIGVYLYLAWRSVRAYARAAADLGIAEVSNTVHWQQSLLACIMTINLSLLLAFALPVILYGSANINSDLVAVPVSALLIYGFMIYKGVSYHVIYNQVNFTALTNAATPVNELEASLGAQKLAPGNPEFLAAKKQQLVALFEQQKVHTRAGLKLYDVAEMLDTSPATVSYIINKQLHMTFFEMLNHYRVEEAKRLFVRSDHRQYKIEFIGQLAGFNSKASFFSVFKKYAGKTPQQFRDSLPEEPNGDSPA